MIFKDISQLFVKTEPLSMINNAPGYTAMCRFWTFKVWGVLDKMGYTNYWRVDDDIYIKLPTGKEPKTGLIREFEDGGYSYAYKKVRAGAKRQQKLDAILDAVLSVGQPQLEVIILADLLLASLATPLLVAVRWRCARLDPGNPAFLCSPMG